MQKVFGVGLNKTGTTSLGKALEILDFSDHISCDLELLRHWNNKKFSEIFLTADKYNNFEDWPWPLLYQELFERYPTAKFILTTRKDEEIWYNSLCKHALKTGPTEHRKIVYGYEMPQKFKEHHIHFYLEHNKKVEHFFKNNAPNNFTKLCWEEGNNWEELCLFLKKPIPNIPFPFLNRAEPNSKKRNWYKTLFSN